MEEWISVKDKLPDVYITVLVAVCPALQSNEVHIAYINKKGRFEVSDEDGNHADFITHWMPLPDPPN